MAVNKKIPRLTVQFLRRFGGYNVGEIATFPTESAEAMIKGSVAIAFAVEEKKPEPKKTTSKTKAKKWQESSPESAS